MLHLRSPIATSLPRCAGRLGGAVLALFLLAGCPDDEAAAPADVGAGDDIVADAEAPDAADASPGDTGEAPDTIAPDASDAVEPPDEGMADVPDDVGPPACEGPCDCEQGFDCVDGACVLGVDAVLCCANPGCPDDELCVTPEGDAGLCGVATAPELGVVIVNEVLTDGEVDGDPNGDGDSGDGVGDEFVEIVNIGQDPVDLGGWTLRDSGLTLPRHTFADGTTLAAGAALVVFGGGTAPDDTATTTFVVANAADPGFSFGLSLDNGGDALRLLDGEGALVALFAYGAGTALPAITDESYTRDPDLTGDFVGHSTAAGADGALFSPGAKVDGASF